MTCVQYCNVCETEEVSCFFTASYNNKLFLKHALYIACKYNEYLGQKLIKRVELVTKIHVDITLKAPSVF